MGNCLVAQSGGPTAVINSSVAGVLHEALESKLYNKVLAGLNGIEGILNKKIIDLGQALENNSDTFKHTPSSGLGSCRYKMKDFKCDESEYDNFFNVLEEFDVDAFFYIGGNDSMDTVDKLSQYAKLNDMNKQIIGIPKTIDNDLVCTDHTPGFGSAAKLISTVVLESYLDSSVYSNNGIFIIETMGRDTGWLAASATLARIDGNPVADFIYVPEMTFDDEKFLNDVDKKFKKQNQVYIVVSEGIRYKDGSFVAQSSKCAIHDKFGHAQLGGVACCLKQMIIDKGITSRVKTLELGVIQRSALHCASDTDLEEAYMAGRDAVKFSAKGVTGHMVSIERISNSPYITKNTLVNVNNVANSIKYLPQDWINEEQNNINEEALQYLSPLIHGNPSIETSFGLPVFLTINRYH